MASTKLIIRNYKGCVSANSTSVIFVLFTHAGKSTLLSTSEKIPVASWDSRRCEAKKSYRGYSTLNMVIHSFKEKVDTLAREAKLSGTEPTCKYIKEHIRGRGKKKESKPKVPTLFKFIEQYIKEQVTLKSNLTIKGYKTTLKQLIEYRDYVEKDISYNEIDLTFYDSFLSFLFKYRNLSNNGAGNHLKKLKLFMGEAYERGYHTNLVFRSKKFKVLSETADTIYLNEQELELMYNYDFSYDKRMERVRDTFYISSWTGLRYSDSSKLTAANIQNGYIVVNTQKTSERVVIPIYPKVQAILNKYLLETGEPFPKTFKTEQKYNVQLKEIGKKIGLVQPVKIRVSRGGKVFQQVYKKYELISSHTARRSAATNMYKQGVPSIVIMKITGHKSEKNFMKYIKISQENAADMLKQYWEKLGSASPAPQNKTTLTESISWN